MTNLTELQNLVDRFHANIDFYKDARNAYNEHSCRIEYIDPLLKLLGWDVANEKGLAPQYREVKTPCTELIGNQYRGTYSFSYELSGAINQVLNYRDKLTKEYYSLCHQSSEPFEVLSPKCVVIIGKMASLTPGQVAAFENFRNSLSNVLILIFIL